MSIRNAMPQRSSRPRELQDVLNYHFYHPLAWKLARRLASTPVTPGMVSIAGGLCIVAAAAVYALPAWPLSALVGLLLHMAWHVLDGADGDLARLTGRASPLGELIDGICDYAGHFVLYLVLTAMLAGRIGSVAWALGIMAGISHIVQSNHFEVQRRQYQWWAYGMPWLRHAPVGKLVGRASFAAFTRAYLGLADALSPSSSRPIDAAVAAAASDPARITAIRELARAGAVALLPRFQLLSNNHRTIALGLSMLAGSPFYYFVYEATALNLALLVSIRRFDAAVLQLGDAIGQLSSTRR